MNKNLNYFHDNKDMTTPCIYIDHIFALIGSGKKYHIFLEKNLLHAYCGSGPASLEKSKQMVRLGSICQNCHRELIKSL